MQTKLFKHLDYIKALKHEFTAIRKRNLIKS